MGRYPLGLVGGVNLCDVVSGGASVLMNITCSSSVDDHVMPISLVIWPDGGLGS